MPEPTRSTPPPPSLPAWLPAEGVKPMSCGEDFDAVRLHRDLGEHVLDVLGDRTGPVIISHPDRRLLWLVPPGVLQPRPPFYDVWGTTCRIDIPAPRPRLGSYVWLTWRIPPSGDCLTDPETLRQALEDILPPEAGDDR